MSIPYSLRPILYVKYIYTDILFSTSDISNADVIFSMVDISNANALPSTTTHGTLSQQADLQSEMTPQHFSSSISRYAHGYIPVALFLSLYWLD